MTEPGDEPLAAESDTSFIQVELQSALDDDLLVQEAIRLGGIVTEVEHKPIDSHAVDGQDLKARFAAIMHYLDTVHIITDEQKLSVLRAGLVTLLQASPASLGDWLRDNRVVFPGCETEVAAHIMRLVKQVLNRSPANTVGLHPVMDSTKSRKPAATKTRRLDLLTVPDNVSEPQRKRQQREQVDEAAPLQLALF